MPSAKEATALLSAIEAGNRSAVDALAPAVYDELRRHAAVLLKGERPEHTLEPTALVNEAYVRLVDRKCRWAGRAHFRAIAAIELRRVLVEHARHRDAQKRGGHRQRVALEESSRITPRADEAVLDVEAALVELEAVDPDRAVVVQHRIFGGLTHEESAHVLGVSPSKVEQDWRFARAWLRRRLDSRESG
jgi:RNA polymerase sigma factor (TIGR02999 family)